MNWKRLGSWMVVAFWLVACGDEGFDDMDESVEHSSASLTSTCNAYYTSESGLDGIDCGTYVYNAYYTNLLYCKRGDLCTSWVGRQCQVKRTCGVGTQYHASKYGWGRWCGERPINYYGYIGPVSTNHYCEERDHCVSPTARTCAKVGITCNGSYDAYRHAGGRVCGYHYVSGMKTYRYCEGGDYCTSSPAGTCEFRTECGKGATYHAYPTGGGTVCGYTYIMGWKYWNNCRPGDTCIASTAGWCRYN